MPEGYSAITPFSTRSQVDLGIMDNGIIGNNNGNINYLENENKWTVSQKFFNSLPTLATIPTFNPTKLSDWIDRLKSFLRSCHSLDYLIRDDKEQKPILLDSESDENFEKRITIFNERNRALYLILDKSLSTNTINLDPKYLSLSEKIYSEETESIGQKLYDGILFLVKGSHLWARLDSINDLMDIKLEKLGSEQYVFNNWKRQVDIQNSFQMDIGKFQKLVLINALSKCKEHKTVVLQLAAMNPEELFSLSAQDILNRFLASAGHLQSNKNSVEVALYSAEDNIGKRSDNNGINVVCYNCNQRGHYKSQCPKLKNFKTVNQRKYKRTKN